MQKNTENQTIKSTQSCIHESRTFCEKPAKLRGKVVGAIFSFIYGKSENVETYRSKCKSVV